MEETATKINIVTVISFNHPSDAVRKPHLATKKPREKGSTAGSVWLLAGVMLRQAANSLKAPIVERCLAKCGPQGVPAMFRAASARRRADIRRVCVNSKCMNGPRPLLSLNLTSPQIEGVSNQCFFLWV